MSLKIFDTSAIIAMTCELKDTDPLIHLKNMGYKLIIPYGVYEEITKPDTKSKVNMLISQEIFEIMNISPNEEEIEEFRTEFPHLHKGETEVLFLGKKLISKRKNICCIIDESAGRDSAEELSLPFHGVLGILNKLEESEIIDNDTHEGYLDDLERQGFWFKRNH